MEPVGGLLQLLDQRLQFSVKLPAFGPFVVLVVVLVVVTISLDAEGREGADRRRIIGRRTVEILDLGRGLYGLVEIVSALQRIRQTEVLLQPNVEAIDAIDDRRELFCTASSSAASALPNTVALRATTATITKPVRFEIGIAPTL